MWITSDNYKREYFIVLMGPADPHARKDRIMSDNDSCNFIVGAYCSGCPHKLGCREYQAHKPAPECKGQVGVERLVDSREAGTRDNDPKSAGPIDSREPKYPDRCGACRMCESAATAYDHTVIEDYILWCK